MSVSLRRVPLILAASLLLASVLIPAAAAETRGSLFQLKEDGSNAYVKSDASPFIMEGGGPLQNSYWSNVKLSAPPKLKFFATDSQSYSENDPPDCQWAGVTADVDGSKYYSCSGGIGAFSTAISNQTARWSNISWSDYQATPVLYKDWMIVTNCWRGISDPDLPFCSIEQWSKQTGQLVFNLSYNVYEHVVGDLVVPSPAASELGRFYYLRGDLNTSDKYNHDVNTTLVAVHIDEQGIRQEWERPLSFGFFYNSFGGAPPVRVSVNSQGVIYVNSVANQWTSQIYVFDSQGNMQHNITLGGTTSQAPAISPSEKYIVNQILVNNTVQLVTYDANSLNIIASVQIRSPPSSGGFWVGTGPTSVGLLADQEFAVVSGCDNTSIAAYSVPDLQPLWQSLNNSVYGGSNYPPVITADGVIFHVASGVFNGDTGIANATLVALDAKTGSTISQAPVNFLGFTAVSGIYSAFSFDQKNEILYFGLDYGGGGGVPVAVTLN